MPRLIGIKVMLYESKIDENMISRKRKKKLLCISCLEKCMSMMVSIFDSNLSSNENAIIKIY